MEFYVKYPKERWVVTILKCNIWKRHVRVVLLNNKACTTSGYIISCDQIGVDKTKTLLWSFQRLVCKLWEDQTDILFWNKNSHSWLCSYDLWWIIFTARLTWTAFVCKFNLSIFCDHWWRWDCSRWLSWFMPILDFLKLIKFKSNLPRKYL